LSNFHLALLPLRFCHASAHHCLWQSYPRHRDPRERGTRPYAQAPELVAVRLEHRRSSWTICAVIVSMRGAYPMRPIPKTFHVNPGSELDRLLAEADAAPLVLEKGGVRYHVQVTRADAPAASNTLTVADEDDIWAGYDPERVRAALRATAGSWGDLDAEA